MTSNGADTPCELYLAETPEGEIKIGVSKYADKRFYQYTNIKILDKILLNVSKASQYEMDLLIKYFNKLIHREDRTLSEYLPESCKNELLKDFDEIHKIEAV